MLGFFDRNVEPDGQVVREMISADGEDGGVGDGAFEEDGELGGGGADVGDADAEFALVGGEDGFGGGDAFEDGVFDFEAGAVGAGDDAIGRCRRSRWRGGG